MDSTRMEKEGWQFGSISSGAHLKRQVETYEELGFEVCLEKIDLATENRNGAGCGTGCTVCYENPAEPPYRIYFRDKKPKQSNKLNTQN